MRLRRQEFFLPEPGEWIFWGARLMASEFQEKAIGIGILIVLHAEDAKIGLADRRIVCGGERQRQDPPGVGWIDDAVVP